ncbi:Rossmann-like and DUF2520 domain-containing protein [Chloroflexota bacterium]
MDSRFRRVGFLGAGRTGTALAWGLYSAGYMVSAVASRSQASARSLASKVPGCEAVATPSDLLERCDVVFLTVPDDAIASVAAELPWQEGQGIIHCSGALSLDVLAQARERGAVVGGLHPLQTFATRESGAQRLAGSAFAIEGEEPLQHWLEEVVRRLKGHAVHLRSQDRPLYHAAAVMGCGYLATLLDVATVLWEAMGFSREEALRALLPLARGTLRNVEAQGPRDGATGPILRGDAGTVRRHLVALAERAPEVLPLYCQAGLSMVALAMERGSIGPNEAREIRDLLSTYLAPVVKLAHVGVAESDAFRCCAQDDALGPEAVSSIPLPLERWDSSDAVRRAGDRYHNPEEAKP